METEQETTSTQTEEESTETGEGVNDVELEETNTLKPISMSWFPVLDMSEAQKVSDNLYEKEIVRAAVIKDKKTGKEIRFDAQFMKEFKDHFDAILASDGYIPVQDVTDKNEHTERTKYQVGVVEAMRLDDEKNPTKVIAQIKLNEDMQKVVDFNPKIGVSIGASYTHLSEEGRPTNVFPRHVAITHRPKLNGMAAWKNLIKMSEEAGILDLTDADYVELTQETEDTERKVNDMAVEKEGQTPTINLTELMEDEAFKSAFNAAVASQVTELTADKDAEIERLRNSVGEVQRSSYEQAVNLAVESYAQAGVPRMIRESAKALLLSFEAGEESKELNLTEGDGDEAKEVKLSRWQAVTRLLDEVKGVIDMTVEQGSAEEVETDGELTGDARKAAVDGLVGLARANRK